MNVEHSRWEETFLALRRAILEADTIDVLMRKSLHIVNTAYGAEGILWVGFEESSPEACRAYATTRAWRAASDRQSSDSFTSDSFTSDSLASETDEPSPTRAQTGTPRQRQNGRGDRSQDNDSGESRTATVTTATSAGEPEALAGAAPSSSHTVRRFRPSALPLWLLHQRKHPRFTQISTGDLILPVTEPKGHSARIARGTDGVRATSIAREMPDDTRVLGDRAHSSHATEKQHLRFIFQLWRPGTKSLQTPAESPPEVSCEAAADDTQIWGWTTDEIQALQDSCKLLLLATDTLSWKRRAEQAQQHTSLLSRTSHLLNSPFHPDLIVKRILAEVGQSIRCDRALLVDLRQQMASTLSQWERPRHTLKPLADDALTYQLWQDPIDLFLQGGASYIEMVLTEDESEPLQEWLAESGAGSALVLPIFIREEFFGAIVLLSHRKERNYFLDELQMAGQGAEHLAIALAMIQSARTTAAARDIGPSQPTPSVQKQMQDPLTRLPNLQALEQELEQLSAPSLWAFHHSFSLMICDLDYFKLVNDTHGYDIGDRVLQRIAERLKKQLRRNTPIYRYGGEEFVILLEATPLQKAKDVAERLRRSIHAMNLKTTAGLLDLTASFGVAQQQAHTDRHALDVLKRAERALFEAKRKGRDRVESLEAQPSKTKSPTASVDYPQ